MPLAVIIPVVAPPFAASSAAKPFAKIDNREVFLRTVELYTPRDQVAQRIIAVAPDDLETISRKYAAHLGFQGVAVTAGGSDWFSCVGRALEKLNPEIDTVMIHDAVCPAVPFTLLDALEAAVARTGAAVPVVATQTAFADAEAEGKEQVLTGFVDMTAVQQVQSPQIFRRALLAEAYAKRATNTYMDDAELVLMTTGTRIATVPGSRFNLRVDSEEMIRLAKDLLGHMPKPKSKAPLTPFDEAQW